MNAAHAKKNVIQKVILESIYNGVFKGSVLFNVFILYWETSQIKHNGGHYEEKK